MLSYDQTERRMRMKPWKLFKIFASVSAVTIGGGYAMIPVIKEYIVDKYKVLGEEELMNVKVQAQPVPGVKTVNTAMILGKELAGFWGAFAACSGAILPPFLIILLVANFFDDFADIPLVKGFFYGARVGVTVILANLSYELVKKNLSRVAGLMVVFAGTLAIVLLNVSSIMVLMAVTVIIMFLNRRTGKERSHD